MARARKKPASKTKAAMSGDRVPASFDKQKVERTAAAWKNAGKGDYYESDQYKALMNQ